MARKSQKKDHEAETIKQRILLLADIINVTRKHLTEGVMGMTMSSFGGDAAKTPINSRALGKLMKFHPETNARWLLTGSGSMFETDLSSDEETSTPQWLVEERRAHNETVLSQQRTIERLTALLDRETTVDIEELIK